MRTKGKVRYTVGQRYLTSPSAGRSVEATDCTVVWYFLYMRLTTKYFSKIIHFYIPIRSMQSADQILDCSSSPSSLSVFYGAPAGYVPTLEWLPSCSPCPASLVLRCAMSPLYCGKCLPLFCVLLRAGLIESPPSSSSMYSRYCQLHAVATARPCYYQYRSTSTFLFSVYHKMAPHASNLLIALLVVKAELKSKFEGIPEFLLNRIPQSTH